ncbi:MAG: SMP-30/gluconolactonase/LRE family protein, partial [Planctomycetia bacterium]
DRRVSALAPTGGGKRTLADTFEGRRFNSPNDCALDQKGRVLIVDTENHCIRRYDPASGRIELVAGTPPRAGTAVGRDLRSTALNRPHGCCLDPAGRLVIADSDNDRILAGPLPE